jgi:hypothetical protein
MPADWVEALGIRDAPSGYAAAWDARERILEPARRVIGSAEDVTISMLVFQGFVARAQGLHEAATSACSAENPHATFTLLRAYAENAAAILYATDKPREVHQFWKPDGHGISIGRITNYAQTRFDAFREIYDQLSKFAHPQALSLLASMSVTEDRIVRWASAPHFKRSDDQLIAYAWAVELAEATGDFLYEFAHQHRLGYFDQDDPEGSQGE